MRMNSADCYLDVIEVIWLPMCICVFLYLGVYVLVLYSGCILVRFYN